ncbi:hypothetical protein HUU05_14620 [candidate division KSB1 bacterium]|nr:hypothetical protein [candidate division KSB1 bacterium]
MKPLSLHPLLIVLGITLFTNPLVAQPTRALWGFEATGAFGGTPQETVAALHELGANAVFSNKLSPELLRALQAANIKVYTTVNVFGDHTLWKRYPHLRPMTSEGELLAPEQGHGLCPTQRWYWPRVLRALGQRLDAGYDGVWLDFIRFSGFWEEARPKLERTCFCDSTLADFSRTTGIAFPAELPPASLNASADSTHARDWDNAAKAAWILANHRSAWRSYTSNVIADFVRQAKETLVKKNANATLGLFVVPWQRDEFNAAILEVLSQDYRKLREHADVFSPMLYHELCSREVEWIARFVEYTARETSKPVWPIIQSDLGKEHRVSDDTFAAAVLSALDPPSQGVIIFNHKALLEAKQTRILGSLWSAKRN